MKKKVSCFIIAILIMITFCSCKSATTTDSGAKNAKEVTGNSSNNSGLTLYCDQNEVDELILTNEYTFPNGTKMSAREGDARTIVMINGTYEPDIQVKIINNTLMLPAKTICELLGFNVNWVAGGNKITVKNNNTTLAFKADDLVALVDNSKITLEESPKMIENTLYVPWAFISEKLNLKTENYHAQTLGLFAWNPIITIDKEVNQPYLSREEGLKYLKDNLDKAYAHFENNFKKLYTPDGARLLQQSSILKKDINNLKFDRAFSRYYIFDGLYYTVFLDKYNKDVYFSITSISQSEIKKIEFDDPKLFEYFYMVD